MRDFSCVINGLKKRYVESAIILVLLAAVAVLGLYFANFGGSASNRQDVWGQFGDFVGGTLNPIFGFMSIVVLVVTLNLQRSELKESRDAALENNVILSRQLNTMHNQSMEITFFRLVEELKVDSVISQCVKKSNIINNSVYLFIMLSEEERQRVDAREFNSENEFFRYYSKGLVSKGELQHIVLEKIVNIFEIANALENSNAHYSVLKTVVGARLLSALIHFSYFEDKESYQVLIQGKRALNGVLPHVIFLEAVAKDLFSEDKFSTFKSENEANETERRKDIEEYVQKLYR